MINFYQKYENLWKNLEIQPFIQIFENFENSSIIKLVSHS